MSGVPTIVIQVEFPAPGGEHLALHLRERFEYAVLEVLADLSDSERDGVRVTSDVHAPDEEAER